MSTRTHHPPLIASGVATLGLGVAFGVMAVLSLASGHGEFSGGVGAMLAVWAVLVAGAGLALLRRVAWVRGLVVALGLLHVLAFGQMVPSQPWAALGAVAGLVGSVGAVLPSTRDALSRDG